MILSRVREVTGRRVTSRTRERIAVRIEPPLGTGVKISVVQAAPMELFRRLAGIPLARVAVPADH